MINKIKFTDLALDEKILQAVIQKGYTIPTPIQAKSIPAILDGRDIMAAAQTGTGKTAGFVLPILQKLMICKKISPYGVRTLILTPTRELAAQVSESINSYSANLNIRHSVIFGGVSINPQKMRLKHGTDILVATPGRLLDLYTQGAVQFSQLEIFVLDEADRMLDMGFIHDIKKIMLLLPAKRQNLLFSATFSNEIRKLAKSIINNPIEISVGVRNAAIEVINQWLVEIEQSQKINLLIHLIEKKKWSQLIVFSRTKHGANKITKKLEAAGIKSLAIHGNKSQNARTKALSDFKDGKINVLVATDIAARGIDINQLPLVLNFDLPHVPEDYVHRIGRTARAGAEGEAISFVSLEESKQLSSIEKLLNKKIPRRIIEDFTTGSSNMGGSYVSKKKITKRIFKSKRKVKKV